MAQTQKKWTSSWRIWRSCYVLGSVLLLPALFLIYSVPALAEGGQRGNELYQTYCGQCHGDNGQGFRDLYPTLTTSSYLDTDLKDLPCIIRFGIRGNILLESGRYNQSMPGNKHIQAEEMTLLIAHLQTLSTNKNHKTPITAETISLWLDDCSTP